MGLDELSLPLQDGQVLADGLPAHMEQGAQILHQHALVAHHQGQDAGPALGRQKRPRAPPAGHGQVLGPASFR
ncbi:hypothetical protein SDC9_186601 [bioreactor metagenome]|uniref:Uncharacterized protein n=1 Tax=bioreactor metagenome TaxID=1076179 RepID=A0A645HJ83_9ZZZZ